MNLNLILIILFAIGVIISGSSKDSKKFFIIWCGIVLLLSVSFKSAYYGTQNGGGADTFSYVRQYKGVIGMSIGDIWQTFLDRYFRGVGESDIGYTLLQWITSRFTSSYHVFSTIADLLFFIPFAKLLNKYCERISEIFLAVLLYVALFHTYAMYGARQFYAMGFGLMFFLYYSEKKYKLAIISLLLGVTIHMSLLLVLVPFVLSFLPNNILKPIHIVTLLLIPVIWIFANPIIFYMGNFIGIERYAFYGTGEMQGGAVTYIVLSVALSIICLILTNRETFEDPRFKYLYAMAPVFTFFTPLIASSGSMMRITAYSQIFETVLLPYLVTYKFGKNAKIYLYVMIIVLSALLLKGNHYPYEFFWIADPVDLW